MFQRDDGVSVNEYGSNLGDTCNFFKIVIWGDKSSVLWSEILFYGDASAKPLNTICDHKTDDLPRKMAICNTVIPFARFSFDIAVFCTNSESRQLRKTRRQSIKNDVTSSDFRQ